jgi:hypothetical protein
MNESTQSYITCVGMEKMILNELGLKSNYHYRLVKGLYNSIVFWEDGKVKSSKKENNKKVSRLANFLIDVLEKTKNKTQYLSDNYLELKYCLRQAKHSTEIKIVFKKLESELYSGHYNI